MLNLRAFKSTREAVKVGPCSFSDHHEGKKQEYLCPGLARHFSLFDLEVGDWTSSIMLRSLPHQVDVMSGNLGNLEVLRSTRACWENKGGRT